MFSFRRTSSFLTWTLTRPQPVEQRLCREIRLQRGGLQSGRNQMTLWRWCPKEAATPPSRRVQCCPQQLSMSGRRRLWEDNSRRRKICAWRSSCRRNWTRRRSAESVTGAKAPLTPTCSARIKLQEESLVVRPRTKSDGKIQTVPPLAPPLPLTLPHLLLAEAINRLLWQRCSPADEVWD